MSRPVPPGMSLRRRVAITVSKALAFYGFAAWVYVALVALVLPGTLPMQLTHLSKYPRTDTFGEVAFVVSLISFIVHDLLKSGGSRRLAGDGP